MSPTSQSGAQFINLSNMIPKSQSGAPFPNPNLGLAYNLLSCVRGTTIASVLQIPTTPTTTPPIIPKKNHETSTVGTVQVADRPC